MALRSSRSISPSCGRSFSESDWAKKNILIAVAGGADDGTSGLRQAADATLRQEIEKFSHIIFSSSQAQREFWLGQRASASMSYGRATTAASRVFTAAMHTTSTLASQLMTASLGSRVRSISTHSVKPASTRITALMSEQSRRTALCRRRLYRRSRSLTRPGRSRRRFLSIPDWSLSSARADRERPP